jgi:hypothetical protein
VKYSYAVMPLALFHGVKEWVAKLLLARWKSMHYESCLIANFYKRTKSTHVYIKIGEKVLYLKSLVIKVINIPKQERSS